MELVTRPGRNRAVACLGEEKIFEYIALVFFLTLMGWLCHAVYYRTGHPWADINGPTVEDGGIHIPVHHWGTESVLSCGIRSVLYTYKLHEPSCDSFEELFYSPARWAFPEFQTIKNYL